MPPKKKRQKRLGVENKKVIITIEDNGIVDVMKGLNIDSFNTLSETSGVMSAYESRSKNRVAIKRSEAETFRVYECVTHKDCVFKARFGRRRKDGKIILKEKQSVFRHVVEESDEDVVKEERAWRRARAATVKGYVMEAAKNYGTVSAVPIRDVVSAAADVGDPIPYHAARRALNKEKEAHYAKIQEEKSKNNH